MTPAALEVLLDAAREGGATEEEVARRALMAGLHAILTRLARRLSPPESASGASAPRPSRETP